MKNPSPLANHLRSATQGEIADMLESLNVDRIEIAKDGRGNPHVTLYARRKRHTAPTVAAAIADMLGMDRVESTVFDRLGLKAEDE